MKRKKLSKKFEEMLTLASKPFPVKGKKLEEKHHGGYSGKKTRSRKTANISD